MVRIPTLVIAGTHSGAGKTSLTLALARALTRRGLKTQTFKVGPDFLDPTYLALASGRPCYNLDGWMAGHDHCRDLFARTAADADCALVEGVMGLFDGADAQSDAGSTAEIARLLSAPILLVVNVHGMGQSLAALVKGYTTFRPDLRFPGIVANHCGSERHAALLREALRAAGLPPLLGAIPRGAFPELASRHLGLVTADRGQLPDSLLDALADAVEANLPLEGLFPEVVAATNKRRAPCETALRRAAFVTDRSTFPVGEDDVTATSGGSPSGTGAPQMAPCDLGGQPDALDSRQEEISKKCSHMVIPAEAGIQEVSGVDFRTSPGPGSRIRNDNAFIKSRKSAINVIPAEAGIQKYHPVTKHWTPAPVPDADPGFAGVTTFYECVKDNESPVSEEIQRPRQSALFPGPDATEGSEPVAAGTGVGERKEAGQRRPLRIGVARDPAFHFYYPDLFDALRAAGCELCFFSPLEERRLPEGLSALYLGGGYPELHAERLAENGEMQAAIRAFAGSGRPLYAECGGLMYLSLGIEAGGRFHPLAGILPARTRMLAARKALGYVEVALTEESLWGRAGDLLRGHEFHYSELVDDPLSDPAWRTVYALRRRRTDAVENEGYQSGAILASYVHLHHASRPAAVAHFIERCGGTP